MRKTEVFLTLRQWGKAGDNDMKQHILFDVKITIDPPSYIGKYYPWMKIEDRPKEFEMWVKEFNDFLRDHRSQDANLLSVECIYKDKCSFCGLEWEEDEDGCPLCCEKAIDEFEAKVKETHRIVE